jgi:glycosyltransferase involved in cell wall biosynthesis
MSTSLCLLTLNELIGCQKDVPQLPRDVFDHIYAVDGGSTDGTVEYLQQHGIEIVTQKRPGLNGACWDAIEHCTTEFLVYFHPKGTTPCADTIKVKQALEQDGCDLVVASRNCPRGRNEEDMHLLKPRKWFVTFLAIVAAAWRREGPIIWDVLHGFRGVRKSAFLAMNPPQSGATIDLAMVVQAYKLRLKRVELPTTETRRLFGETHFKILPTGLSLLLYAIKEVFRKKTSYANKDGAGG